MNQRPIKHKMELRHFRYFVAVAEERSFVHAARRLRVAQPAVSKQIRDLEREIGVTLFERLPRGVRLTRGGEAFLLHARDTLEAAACAAARAREADADVTLPLRLAHAPTIAYAPVLADLLVAFRQAHPDAAVLVRRLNELNERAALREQRVDVVATFVGTWPDPEFAGHRLLDAAFTGVLLPAGHPLAARPQVSLRDLSCLTWLHVPSRSSPDVYRIQRTAVLSRGLVPTRHRGRWPDAPSANVQLAAGGAWALANETIARYYGQVTAAVVYRPFVEAPIPFWFALLWRHDSTSPHVRGIVEVAGRFPIAAPRVRSPFKPRRTRRLLVRTVASSRRRIVPAPGA